MSKLVTEKVVLLEKDKFQGLLDLKKKYENTHHSSVDIVGALPKGVNGYYKIDKKDGEIVVRFSFSYKGKYYGIEKDGSVSFSIDASNWSELQQENKRVEEALTIIKGINLDDFKSEVEKSIDVYHLLNWTPHFYNFKCLFEYFETDKLDKHETCKTLWKMSKEDLDSDIQDFYYRNKNEGVKMYGKWFDDLSEKVELLDKFNQKYN